MKNYFFGIVALLMVELTSSVDLFAQWNFGVRGGINIPQTVQLPTPVLIPIYNMAWDINTTIYHSPFISLFIEKTISDHFALQSGLEITSKKFRVYATSLSIHVGFLPSIDSELKSQYIEIPVYLKGIFLSNGIEMYVLLGGQICFNTVAEATITERDEQYRIRLQYSVSIKDIVKSFSIAPSGGVGLQYLLPWNVSIFAEARYIFGLQNLSRASNSPEIRMRDLRLNLGVSLRLF